MPSPTKSTRRFRSRSPARTKSKSRSRSRSRGRSKSPGRPRKQPTQKQSPSPARSQKKTITKTPTTPTRQSKRLIELAERKEEEIKHEQHEEKTVQQTKGSKRETKPKAGKTKPEYIYGGPIATFISMLLMPSLGIWLNLACTKDSCSLKKLPTIPRTWQTYLDAEAAMMFFGFVAVQAILAWIPVGTVVEGMPLKDGSRLKYRCNGMFAFMVTTIAFSTLVYLGKPVSVIYDKLIPLQAISTLFSFALALVLFLCSRSKPSDQLEAVGNTGCLTHDFYVGAELNPRLFGLDMKMFGMFRAGLMAFVMVVLSFVVKAYLDNGGKVPFSLYFMTAGAVFLCVDALWFEEGLLSTAYFQHDTCGFMMLFVSYSMMPFTYTLGLRYMLEHPQNWNMYALGGFMLLFVIGYVIYRGSNSQKALFRKNPYDPSLAHLEVIPAPSGKKLLVSGWWGLCRHPNYLGDLIMAVAMALPMGCDAVIPYFGLFFSAMLFMVKVEEDYQRCKAKYGAAWDRYCGRVKHKLIPYIY